MPDWRPLAIAVAVTAGLSAQAPPPITRFFEAASTDERVARAALAELAAAWSDSYTAMVIDMARLMRAPRPRGTAREEISLTTADEDWNPLIADRPDAPFDPPSDPGSPVRRRLIAFLEQRTGHSFGNDLHRWREWMWKLPYTPHPDYAIFKGLLYGQIDPRMRSFFPPGVRASIRLDEIDWGGVTVNGIPPLREPRVIPAAAADYLKDSNLVFGIVVNGEARAYPKRILAWHELATDRVGGVELTIVYCTLCGTVIPFDSQAGGRRFRFGTSGLLYRSNKLMFDEETLSLWSTFEGVPVVGPLIGSGVALSARPIVTTTWREWRIEHPDTTVLSIETGHKRDYSEGAAYRDYFSTDRLMFRVSHADSRLRNKAEVLVMQIASARPPGTRVPVAIDVRFLKKRPIFSFSAVDDQFVVVTTPQGANRVYRTAVKFQRLTRSVLTASPPASPALPASPAPAFPTLTDMDGRRWRVTEDALVLEADPSVRAERVAGQRAFWFGWYAQFPQTLLIK